MTVGELIERLGKFSPNKRVMILDGFNGGGEPRTINLGPTLETVEDNGDYDCEGLNGEKIVVMGYGCY